MASRRGFNPGVTRITGLGHVDRAVVRPGWDISLAGAMYRAVAELEMCPLASLGQGQTAPGAGMSSCTMAGGVPGAGKGFSFPIFFPEC